MRSCLATIAIIAASTLALAQDTRPPASSSSASAPETSSQPTTIPSVDLGIYAPMVTDCNLTPEQHAKLARKVIAIHELADQEKEQCAQLLDKLALAYKAKDNQQVVNIRKETDRLRLASAQVLDSLQAEILAMLDHEQRLAWETAELERKVTARYRQLKFELTDAQVDRLREAIKTEATDLARLANWPTPAQARQVMNSIDHQVLTEHQRLKAASAN